MTPDSPPTRDRPDALSGEGMVAVDLGGTHMRVAIFGPDGKIVHKTRTATPSGDPDALSQAMRAAIEEAGLPVHGAVVGVPGVVHYASGRPLMLPNLPQWESRLSSQWLASSVEIPVLLANDADLAALGEHRHGAGRGASDMLYMTSSTGVGAGVIIGGQLLHGRYSLAEAGHTVIDRSSGSTLEQLGSGTALKRIAGLDGAEVTSRALAGDKPALATLEEVADAFAVGVLNMVQCFMPERVVIGGGVSRAGDLLLDPIRRRIADSWVGSFLDASDIVRASGDDDVGLLGGLAMWEDCTDWRLPDTRIAPTPPSGDATRTGEPAHE